MSSSSVARRRLALGAGALSITWLAPLEAHAYCRGVAANAPSGYEPTLSGCFAPAGAFDLYWKNLCVGYDVQKNASPLRHITLDEATRVVSQAFARWSRVSCASGGAPSVKAEDLGPVECALVRYNDAQPNQHVIILHDDPWPYTDSSNTIGLTTLTYDATDGEIFDADMEINTHDFDLVVSGPVPSGGYDLASVITHEAGHFLGLAHSTDSAAVMYAHYPAGESALTADDDDGICAIYPPSGTRVTSSGPLMGGTCDPTPRHGFSSACASPNAEPANGGAGGGAPATPPTRASACSVGGAGADRGRTVPFALSVLALLVWMARRLRRAPRGAAHRVTAACTLALLVGTVSTVATREARASVSIAVVFEELARDALAIATVTPLEQRSAWENGRIFTYTRVNVNTLVAGELPREVWIRTMGGVVGTTGQIVDGEATFVLGNASLLFLGQRLGTFEVIARGQGQFPIVTGADGVPRLVSAGGIGALLPPPPARIERLRSSGVSSPRFARDVLRGRSVVEATRDITATWTEMHAK